ncbi:MAG: NADH-quinone oxidoreductase subunit C [Methanolinea sp.]|jgi:membrane-bound hydrogenase subunit beta|nr:NADH-quinone oxidoreductase subunit C [Methanolinea sp.]
MTEGILTPGQVVEHFTGRFGTGIHHTRIDERREGKKKIPNYNIWIDLEKDLLKPAIGALMELHFPHLAVISGSDMGESLRLLYHFSIYYGRVKGEYTVTFAVMLPKADLSIPTISDLIPGAVFSEREKQEFLGVKVIGIPDDRRLFLPEDFPDGIYPWRKDGTGIPDSMVKDLWASKRPVDRPAPPLPEVPACRPDEGEKSGAPAGTETGKEGSS